MHVPDRLDLVEDDLDLPAAARPPPSRPGRPRRPARPSRRARGRAAGASSRTTTTSKCWAATAPELAHVVVAPVAGRADHADPRGLGRGRLPGLLRGVAVDEVAEHPHAGGVVAVVDERRRRCRTSTQVHPAGGEVVARREGAQALADVVQRGAGGERRAGRGQRVRDVEPGRAAERRRQQVRPGQLHRAAAVLDDDHLAALGRLEHDGPATATAVVVDELAHLAAGRARARTTRPRREQRRRISRTSGSSALSTANPSRGTASTMTALTSASCSRVSMPRMPRWSGATLVTTATSLRS